MPPTDIDQLMDVSTVTSSGVPRHMTRLFSLRNERLFCLGLLVSIVPIWLAPHLPMVDLPQHAAQIVAMKQIWAGNDAFTQVFQINWFTPYLLGYLLLFLGSLVMPVEMATQILVSLAVMSVPLITGRLLQAAGGDQRWKWLAIPASYSFAFYWGFLSFMIATPIALLFLMHAIRFARAPTLREGLITAAFSIFLFFCHVIVLCFVSLMALAYIAGVNYRNLRNLVVSSLPFTAPLPLIAVWLVITYTSETSAQQGGIAYATTVLDRVYQLIVQPTGYDKLYIFLTAPAFAAVILLPGMCGARISRRPERWLPFLVGLTVYMLIPGDILNTGFIAYRLGLYLTPMWLLMWDEPAVPPKQQFDWLVFPVVVTWALVNAGRFTAFARETEDFEQVSAAAAGGTRIGAMIQANASPLFDTPVYMHYVAWHQADRLGIVDFNFADFYVQTVRYRADVGPRIGERNGWNPRLFDWDKNGGVRYDYFIVRSSVDLAAQIFKEKASAVELVTRSGPWWLYRNKERASPEQQP